jgi:hypothetical protein
MSPAMEFASDHSSQGSDIHVAGGTGGVPTRQMAHLALSGLIVNTSAGNK